MGLIQSTKTQKHLTPTHPSNNSQTDSREAELRHCLAELGCCPHALEACDTVSPIFGSSLTSEDYNTYARTLGALLPEAGPSRTRSLQNLDVARMQRHCSTRHGSCSVQSHGRT